MADQHETTRRPLLGAVGLAGLFECELFGHAYPLDRALPAPQKADPVRKAKRVAQRKARKITRRAK